MEKPTFFTKVLKSLRQLSTTKGFTIKQITEQFQHLDLKRDHKEIKSIVEKSLRYGVKNKLLLEKCGKFHLSPAKLQSLNVESSPQKKKTKHVRFKKGKTNINDALKKKRNKSNSRKNRKQNLKSRKSRKANTSSRSTSRRSVRTKSGHRGRKRNVHKKTETVSESETADERNQESAKNSKTELIVENKENKEALDVTPDRDVHDNCVNKNKDRSKGLNVIEPPRLESDTDIGWEPKRPTTKLDRESLYKPRSKRRFRSRSKSRSRPRSRSRHSSKVRKHLKSKHKHNCSHEMKRRKHLRNFTPDDKMYRKYKTRSRRNYDYDKSEESSDFDSSFKEKACRKCHHNCKGRCCQRHYSPNEYVLERKVSNTILDHLNSSKTILDTTRENLTPFDVFFEANHNSLETIAENVSMEDNLAEEVENEKRDEFDTSYIN